MIWCQTPGDCGPTLWRGVFNTPSRMLLSRGARPGRSGAPWGAAGGWEPFQILSDFVIFSQLLWQALRLLQLDISGRRTMLLLLCCLGFALYLLTVVYHCIFHKRIQCTFKRNMVAVNYLGWLRKKTKNLRLLDHVILWKTVYTKNEMDILCIVLN